LLSLSLSLSLSDNTPKILLSRENHHKCADLKTLWLAVHLQAGTWKPSLRSPIVKLQLHCRSPGLLLSLALGHYGWNRRDRDHAGRWSQASEEGSRESGTIAAFHMASRAQRPLVGYTVSICHSAVEHSHLSLWTKPAQAPLLSQLLLGLPEPTWTGAVLNICAFVLADACLASLFIKTQGAPTSIICNYMTWPGLQLKAKKSCSFCILIGIWTLTGVSNEWMNDLETLLRNYLILVS
jgi:hypothetical protein